MENNSNLLRAIIGIVIAAILIFGAVRFAGNLAASKEKPKTKSSQSVNKIYTQVVTNSEVPISFFEKGILQAVNKVELYSEVQGILKSGNQRFKPGQSYAEGATIFSIDDGEFGASLVAQKSVLYNLISQIMPDLRLDYPEVFEKWKSYLDQFDIKKTTPALPTFDSDKEKFFINAKNIVTTYYNIRNLEERHKKYNIYAPFNAVVTESLVNPGTLVRAGQKLGTIINPSAYEIAISINESFTDFLQIGKSVNLSNLKKTQSWKGKISRIDPTINTTTQGILAYINVRGKGLKEGMFLEAQIEAIPLKNAFVIPRKLLVENNKTYIVRDHELHLVNVEIGFFKEQSAIITNLPDGTVILKNAIPDAYEGMRVEPIN